MASVAVGVALYSVVDLFLSWTFMLTLLAGVLVAQHLAGWHRELPSVLLRFHVTLTCAFIVGATVWKRWLAHTEGKEPGDTGGFGNRVQHLAWGAATVALLLPLLARWWKGRRRWEMVLIAVAAVSLIGNAVEVIEHRSHVQDFRDGTHDPRKDYDDTVADLIMNVIGSAAGAAAAIGLQERRRVSATG